MLEESRMTGEVILLAVLKDEDAAFGKYALVKYKSGNLRQFLQGVGRVCKYEVKLLSA